MNAAQFQLDPRLAADTRLVAQLNLCDVRLMDDARFPWLVLVPRRPGINEVADLDDAEQCRLWQETRRAAEALRACFACDKLNLGQLGNVVRQLHVHVIARVVGDAAWPGPAWGNGQAVRYSDDELAPLLSKLARQVLRRHRT